MSAEWTVMVFLNGDNSLEKHAIDDFKEMAGVGSTDKVNIIVQFDRKSKHEENANTVPQWNQCLRFRVQKNMEPVSLSALQDLGEVNMGDGKVLADFVQWAMKEYPARHYMLDIWDHGQGWRTGKTKSALSTSFENVSDIPAGTETEIFSRSCSDDDTDYDRLYNREIQDSLLKILQGKRIDLIGFDACLMGMIETAFAMRQIGKIMVASEEIEPGAGWDYSDWLQYLVNHPTMDEVILAKKLVESYKNTYKENSSVTLSAIDLNQIDTLSKLVSDLAQEMIQKINTELSNIRYARSGCREYNYDEKKRESHGIDLGHFCNRLSKTTKDPSLRDKSKAVISTVESCVIANYAGKERRGNYGLYGSQGIAIYFPETKALFDADVDGKGYLESNKKYPLEFVQVHLWDNFLQAYYALLPKSITKAAKEESKPTGSILNPY